MTSKPLHRPGDGEPRAQWPPPTIGNDDEPADDVPVAVAWLALFAIFSTVALVTVAVLARVL